jgi:hypothetical protein
LALAILVAGALISVSIIASSAFGTKTVTQTNTATVVSTTSVISTSTLTQTILFSDSSSTTTQVYQVTFQQMGACSPEFWGVPWSVMIGNQTEVQPPNATLPLNDNGLYGTTNKSLVTIVFSLPKGMYDINVHPSNHFFEPNGGVVDVTGNVSVQIRYVGTSCTISTKT